MQEKEQKKKICLNGLAHWILLGLMTAGIIYNAIVSHAVIKNEIKHLNERVTEINQKVEKLTDLFIEQIMRKE